MRKTANYRVVRLSSFCTDPEVAERVIRKAMGWGLQLQQRTVRKMKLERLLRSSVGTGKVEKLAVRLAKEMRGGRDGEVEMKERRRMIRRKVLMLMRDKVADAKDDANLAHIQYCKSKKELWKVISWESRLGFEVKDVIRREMAWEWQERRKQMEKSVDYLVKKHRLLR